MMISPEDLKRVAEYIGYKLTELTKGYNFKTIYVYRDGKELEYSPLTNPEQLLEIVEKIKPDMSHGFEWSARIGKKEAGLFAPDNRIDGRGKTLPEAVIKAVLEMLGEEK